MMIGTDDVLKGMFGRVESGKCRLSVNGGIAIKTKSGYKTYDLKSGKLTNCQTLVFDVGDIFFVIPVNKVEPGDIIFVAGKPKCVVEAKKNEITVVNYEEGTKEIIIPERHMFWGSAYFYGKIVSMFGTNINGKKGFGKIMKYMMLSEMMKGNNSPSTMAGGNMFGNMMPMMMLMGGNGFDDMFSGILGDDDEANPLKGLTDMISGVTSTDEEEADKKDEA